MGATALPQHLVPRRRTSPSLHTNRKHPEGNDTPTNRPGQTARPLTTVICAKPEFSRKVHTAHKRIHLRRESLAGGGGRGEAPPPIPGVPGRCTGQTTAGRDAALSPAAGGSWAPPRGDGLRGARALRHPAPPPSAPTEGPVRASRWRVTFPAYETKDPKCRRAPHASQSGVPSGHLLPHFLSTSPQTQTRWRAPGGWKPGAEGTGPGWRPSPGDEDTETCCSDSERLPRGFRDARYHNALG